MKLLHLSILLAFMFNAFLSKSQSISPAPGSSTVCPGEFKTDLKTSQPKRWVDQAQLFAGPNASFLRGNPSVENNSVMSRRLKVSYAFGIGIGHALNSSFGFQALVFAERKGTIMKSSVSYFDEAVQAFRYGRAEDDYIYEYYTFSFPLSYSFGDGTRCELGAGPYLGYLVRQRVRTTYSFRSVVYDDETDVDEPIDFGCSLKASLLFSLSDKMLLSVSLLNNLGLFNTRSVDDYGVIKTNSSNLLIGIIFNR